MWTSYSWVTFNKWAAVCSGIWSYQWQEKWGEPLYEHDNDFDWMRNWFVVLTSSSGTCLTEGGSRERTRWTHWEQSFYPLHSTGVRKSVIFALFALQCLTWLYFWGLGKGCGERWIHLGPILTRLQIQAVKTYLAAAKQYNTNILVWYQHLVPQ